MNRKQQNRIFHGGKDEWSHRNFIARLQTFLLGTLIIAIIIMALFAAVLHGQGKVGAWCLENVNQGDPCAIKSHLK